MNILVGADFLKREATRHGVEGLTLNSAMVTETSLKECEEWFHHKLTCGELRSQIKDKLERVKSLLHEQVRLASSKTVVERPVESAEVATDALPSHVASFSAASQSRIVNMMALTWGESGRDLAEGVIALMRAMAADNSSDLYLKAVAEKTLQELQ